MNLPKISIVTPSYNQGQFLEQTIQSVLNQNYPNLEYIIIDGGSTDNSVEIIQKYEKHLTYWVSEPDKGQSHAINKGLAKCTGEVFNWLCSDDYYAPKSLWKIGERFSKNSNLKIVAAKQEIFEEGNPNFKTFTTQTNFDCFTNNMRSISLLTFHQPSTFWKLATIQELGEIDEKLHYAMDLELWVKYLLKYGTKYFEIFNDIIVHYRLHSSSKSVEEGIFEPDSTTNQFDFERYSIYLEVAKLYNISPYTNYMEKQCFSKLVRNYQMKHLSIDNKKRNLIEKAANYHLFRMGELEYENGNFKASNILLKHVQNELLPKEDQINFKKIYWRSYFPFLIRAIRKLKGKA